MEPYARYLTPLAIALTAALGWQPVAAQETMDLNKSELIRSLLPSVVRAWDEIAESRHEGIGTRLNSQGTNP
jgi:hypothetical protein